MAKGNQPPRRKPRGRNQRARKDLGPAPGITITYKGEARPEDHQLDGQTIAASQLFESLTGQPPLDLYSGPDRTIFILESKLLEETSKVLTKNRREQLRKRLGHPVEIVPYAREVEAFATNLFQAFTPESLEVINAPTGTIVHVSLPMETKGRAIGKGGSRLAAVRELLVRSHNVKDLVLT